MSKKLPVFPPPNVKRIPWKRPLGYMSSLPLIPQSENKLQCLKIKMTTEVREIDLCESGATQYAIDKAEFTESSIRLALMEKGLDPADPDVIDQLQCMTVQGTKEEQYYYNDQHLCTIT